MIRLIYRSNTVKPAYSYTTILSKNVRMISSKQRTIAISAIAIVAVLVLFASAPLITTHQAYAFWGGGCGGGCGGCGGWGW
ncbi:MAG: hypothetical protein WAK17_06940 [Candidatus Nitrosopolaris sp.]